VQLREARSAWLYAAVRGGEGVTQHFTASYAHTMRATKSAMILLMMLRMLIFRRYAAVH